MWVTQTYLGRVEPDAKVFIYYLFEDYNNEQQTFTESVQRKLEELGVLYEDNVSLLMPNPRYAARIETELRGIQDLWWSLQGKLPGLFITTKPLSEFSVERGSCYFISFKSVNDTDAAKTINQVRQLVDKQLAWEHQNPAIEHKDSFLQKLFKAIEAKPGIGGFSIDLKELARKG